MNLEEYQTKFFTEYSEFANVVRALLEKAIARTPGLPRPQSIQCRAKSVESLREKLEDRNLSASTEIEKHIRDLAGARLIFYTNRDVDRFLNSRLIAENFEVPSDKIRIHHPVKENLKQRYQAIHYTICLNSHRLALPEYASFAGMQCEVQIQTVLNHAWAETSHDIIYKSKLGMGFGSKAMQSIERRMSRIMDEYLLPAGHELQKVQHDFERLMQGKALFDRGMITSLEQCSDNNDRYDVISTINDHVIPNYDEPEAIYPELTNVLLSTLESAFRTEPIEIHTPFGKLEGKTAKDIATIVLNVFSKLRYVNVECTFNALRRAFKMDEKKDYRDQIIQIAKHLAEYNLHVWKTVGPGVQLVLTDHIEHLSSDERFEVRDMLLPMWQEMLSPELSGTSFEAETVTISSASIQVSDHLKRIRRSAIDGIVEVLDRVETQDEKTIAINAVREATKLPYQSAYSALLCSLIFADTIRLTEVFSERAARFPYMVRANVESYVQFDYQRANDFLARDDTAFANCKEAVRHVIAATLAFARLVNADKNFVRYKTLVGFNSVTLPQWEGHSQEYQERENYRKGKIAEFIKKVNSKSEKEWFELIEICASTRSPDLATFPLFCEFLVELGSKKPTTAKRFLDRASDNLLSFLPAFLEGMFRSRSQKLYSAEITKQLAEGKQLGGLALHWRRCRPDQPIFLDALLQKAIASSDDFAVIECIAICVSSHGSDRQPDRAAFFMPAITYMLGRNVNWVRQVSYFPEAVGFFGDLSAGEVGLVLDSFVDMPKIDYDMDRVLSIIAGKCAEAVWEFLAARIKQDGDEAHKHRYEAVPYQLHELKRALSKDVSTAVNCVRGLYRKDDPLFEFGGARLLSQVFPLCSEELASKLSTLALSGSDEDLDFVLTVAKTYRGQPAILGFLRDIVLYLDENDSRRAEVEICIENTGVVAGQFGFVEAYRAKKQEMGAWLEDEHPKVRAFAEAFIAKLDRRIAFEQRSAEDRFEQRRLEYQIEETDDIAE